MRRNSEKGFSLIELSIVLIIIGLLIAGITGGASLVKSATVRAVISEANSFNSAVNAYYAKRSNLPGDDATQTNGAGNGDGRIKYLDSSSGTVVFEGVNAWYHLALEDVVEGNFTAAKDFSTFKGDAIPGEDIPSSKLSAAGWAMDFRDDMNMLILSNPIGYVNAIEQARSNNVISPENAESIDIKMDDGLANQGKIRAYVTADTSVATSNTADGNMTYDGSTTPAGYLGFALAL